MHVEALPRLAIGGYELVEALISSGEFWLGFDLNQSERLETHLHLGVPPKPSSREFVHNRWIDFRIIFITVAHYAWYQSIGSHHVVT